MKLLSVIYAPFMMLGYVGLGIVLVDAGVTYWSLALLLGLAVATSFLAESFLPYEPTWNCDHGDRVRDALHFVVNESSNALSLLSIPLVAGLIPWTGIWPHDLPLFLQLIIAIVVADFGITTAHYYSHRWQWLWRFHAVHHSVERLYGFNGLMKHPLHQSVEALAGISPLLLVGMPIDVGVLLALAIAIQLLLQHSNVDIRIGSLRRWLALAPIHRFHHQKEAGIGDVNFGLFTTLWDRYVFDTAIDDASRRFKPGEFGIGAYPDYPHTYLQQIIEPFRSSAAENQPQLTGPGTIETN